MNKNISLRIKMNQPCDQNWNTMEIEERGRLVKGFNFYPEYYF